MHASDLARPTTAVKRGLLAVAVALAVVGVFAGVAEAGKPSSASLSSGLSCPASVATGETFHVSGSGYDPSKQAWVQVVTSSSSGYVLASVDASGVMSLDYAVSEAGQASLTAYQTSGKRTTQTQKGSCTVSVT
jgi:hypothetical protein